MFPFPDMDISECNRRIDDIEGDIAKLDNDVFELSRYKDYVHQALLKENDTLNNKKAKLSLSDHYEKVSSVCGWLPEKKEGDLRQYLDSMEGLIYEITKPEATDDIPIQLRNNMFSKLFEPITNLFALPSYGEFDLTPFFASW